MFASSICLPCQTGNGHRQRQPYTLFPWVLLDELSSAFAEIRFPWIHLKRQKVCCRASVNILPPPNFRTKEFVCTYFPLSILAGNGNPQYSCSKQTSPRPHTYSAQRCCPPFSPTTHKDVFSKQITTGERTYSNRAPKPHNVNTTYHKQLSKPFCLCDSAPNQITYEWNTTDIFEVPCCRELRTEGAFSLFTQPAMVSQRDGENLANHPGLHQGVVGADERILFTESVILPMLCHQGRLCKE